MKTGEVNYECGKEERGIFFNVDSKTKSSLVSEYIPTGYVRGAYSHAKNEL